MFVDILNSFQPVQFFMDSPIWVTVVVFGVIGIFRKVLTVSIMVGVEQAIEEIDKGEPVDGIAGALVTLITAFIVAIINAIYLFSLGYVSLSVLTHKGVDNGFPVAAGLCIIVLLSWGLSALAYKVIAKLRKKP
jgi:hypothetical protein